MKNSTVTTQWQQLAIEAAVDDDGILHSVVHFIELNSGQEFTISISGKKDANTAYWIGSLRALVAAWEKAAGAGNSQNAQFVGRSANH